MSHSTVVVLRMGSYRYIATIFLSLTPFILYVKYPIFKCFCRFGYQLPMLRSRLRRCQVKKPEEVALEFASNNVDQDGFQIESVPPKGNSLEVVHSGYCFLSVVHIKYHRAYYKKNVTGYMYVY